MIDMRTVILSYIISNAICAIVVAFLWFDNRRRFAGLGFWLADFAMQFAALLLASLRGYLPDLLSMTLSNTLAVGGTVLLFIGLEQFVGKRSSQTHNIILLVIFICVHAWYTVFDPRLDARNIILSLGLLAICSQCAWLLLRRVDDKMLPITRGIGIIFVAYCSISVFRIFEDLTIPVGQDFFKSNVYDTVIVMIYQMLFIALTVGLTLVVNRRLVEDLELDIANRGKAEAALKLSDEKFFKAFHSSPDAIILTRARDGQVVEVNEGFTRIAEYSQEEALSNSVIGLGLWADSQNRDTVLAELREHHRVRDVEYDFRTKSGRVLSCLYSGEIIQLNGEAHILSVVRDITEQYRMEKELRESEKRFRQVAENASEWIWEVDQNGRYTYVSSGVTQILGYSPEELVARMCFYDLFDPVNRELLKQEALGVFARKESFKNFTNINLHKNGRHIIFLTSGVPILDAQNNLVGYRGVDTDITERKQMEEDLRLRNNVLSTLHQVTLDLINRHDVDDILQSFLTQISVFLNAPDISVDLLEDNSSLVTHAVTSGQPLQIGDTMRRGEGGWLSWQAIDSGQPAVLEDYSKWERRRELFTVYPIRAIMIIPILLRASVIGTINISRLEENKPFTETDVDAAQQMAQMVALVLDNAKLYAQLQSELTKRRRIEAALRESQENFQRYFDMGAVGMCVTSPEKGWIEVNDHLCRMLGYPREELAQLTWTDLTHPDDMDADLNQFNQILAGERDSYQLDKRFIRKDGSVLHTSLFVSCHRNTDGTVQYFLASLVDITERKQADAALLKLAAIEERQRLARDLHDSVNQSIHSLVLFADTLISTLEKNNAMRASQIAKRLHESARQALKEMRLMLYEFQPSDPERGVNFIQDLETRLSTVERRAGVRVQIVQKGSMENCPQEWYENLFWITIEALNNALKHAQARTMQVVIKCSSRNVSLEIADDGIGFDPEVVRSGGFGLRTMRERADLLGGWLTIDSSPGKGARVCFHAEMTKEPA